MYTPLITIALLMPSETRNTLSIPWRVPELSVQYRVAQRPALRSLQMEVGAHILLGATWVILSHVFSGQRSCGSHCRASASLMTHMSSLLMSIKKKKEASIYRSNWRFNVSIEEATTRREEEEHPTDDLWLQKEQPLFFLSPMFPLQQGLSQQFPL